MHGTYTIQANYYGSSTAKLFGPTTVQATVFANFGRPNEKRHRSRFASRSRRKW